MASYWTNRRRREAMIGKPNVTSTEKRIEFNIDNKPYLYVYKTTSKTGFAYIYSGKTVIYGPYEKDVTDEGRKVYELLQKERVI